MKVCITKKPKVNIQQRLFHAGIALLLACFALPLTVFAQTTNYDFNLQVSNLVYTLAVQSDGKILVGSIHSPLRLQTNGEIDATFDAGLPFSGACYTIAVQDDDKILVGGSFTSAGGQPRTNLARFNPDGALDNGFSVAADFPFSAAADVFSLAFEAGGSKLVGGYFDRLGGQFSDGLGRLGPNDFSDSTFNPGGGIPFSLAVQSDDRILVGGFFNSLGGQSQTNLGRLNPDGTLDGTFRPSGVDEVECLAGQADGKILAGTTVAFQGGQMTNLVRFDSYATLDTNFNPKANSAVLSIAVQADGKIIVGG